MRDSELFRLAQILPLFKPKGKYGILIKTWKCAMVMINIILIKDIIVGWVLPQFPARVPCLFQRETNIMTLALSLRIVLFFYKNKNNLLWENGVGDLAICHPQPRQWNRSSCSWILVVGSVYCLVFQIPTALGLLGPVLLPTPLPCTVCAENLELNHLSLSAPPPSPSMFLG